MTAPFRSERAIGWWWLRDRLDLSGGDAEQVRLGKHRFSVQTRALELTLVPHEGGLALHLTGTDYFEPIVDPALEAGRPYWDRALVSESVWVPWLAW